MSEKLSCFDGRDRYQVVAVYPSGGRYDVREPHDTLEAAVWHRELCERSADAADGWRYEVDVTYTGADGQRHWRGRVDKAYPNVEPKPVGAYVRHVHPCDQGTPDGVVLSSEMGADTVGEDGQLFVRCGRGSTVYGPARNWRVIDRQPAWLEEA
jgi:hypothetical protein